jgi:hypothetical protein
VRDGRKLSERQLYFVSGGTWFKILVSLLTSSVRKEVALRFPNILQEIEGKCNIVLAKLF